MRNTLTPLASKALAGPLGTLLAAAIVTTAAIVLEAFVLRSLFVHAVFAVMSHRGAL
jgi:hypothetical protein